MYQYIKILQTDFKGTETMIIHIPNLDVVIKYTFYVSTTNNY